MLHFDYEWDLYPDRIVLDKELNVERLKWKPGEYWQMCEDEGRRYLRRVDPLMQFLIDGKESTNG